MCIEKSIFEMLVQSAGAINKVKGISPTQLVNLRDGKSGISTKKLKEVLELNGLSATVTLKFENTTTIINL